MVRTAIRLGINEALASFAPPCRKWNFCKEQRQETAGESMSFGIKQVNITK